ncbi:hypothetical protein, conserved [Plasmodium gonderi]|uniref:Uncharacterized protein n=1 Tax=Plasmodium gonderi TaxID=77519 RepID=A0A1Y1JFU3_PLAGO|nr:hypothetical protein, conserved [Plasmodium gonderi]GAW78964.1 hypothetical protein, conserved [Plasmodium gonderi]
MSVTHNDSKIYEQSLKITKKIKEKIVNRKGTKEDFKEIKVKNVSSKFIERNFKIISLSLGYFINTFFYFTFCFVLNQIISKYIYAILSPLSHYDYGNSLLAESIKATLILLLWFRYISAGYDGDPFFHFFKSRLNLISRNEAKVIFISNLIGTCTHLLAVKLILGTGTHTHPVSTSIIERIQQGTVTKNNSILTAFVYPNVSIVIKEFLIQFIILTCPYTNNANKYHNKTFSMNTDLYSSIVMDTYLNELICSFLSYTLLYIYLFTKDNLSYALEVNLIFTQVISLFSTRCTNAVSGPFMSLSWILNEFVLKKYHYCFFLFLMIFHYFGYKLASLLLGPPNLSLIDATNYYKNVKQETLQKYTHTETGRVNISLIPNTVVTHTSLVDSYLGRLFQKCYNTCMGTSHGKKTI